VRILIFNESFYPSVGGVESFINTLSNYLHELGVDVTIITNSKSNGEPDINHNYNVCRSPSKNTIKELIARSELVHLNSFDPYIYF